MTEQTTDRAPGTPIWTDLGSPDVEASKAFYGEIFGWQSHTIPDPQAAGYTMFLLDGKMVAAVGPLMNPQQPPAWTTYISTTDAKATAEAVRSAGGQVIVESFDVMGQGHMGVFVDSTGAHFSVWQPGIHRGAELFNSPGAMGWNELNTRDIEGGKAFYHKVFGWESETNPTGEGALLYTTFKNNGQMIGGGMDMNAYNAPESVPPHWLVYFTVTDADATVAKVAELGGKVIVPPMDIEPGRFAVVSDPAGAVFAMFQTK